MNKEALCHIQKSNYAYAYKLDELHIRLRTAKDDLEEVTLFYGNKFNWQDKKSGRMQKVYQDEYYDYYEYRLQLEDTRLGYYFGLKKGEDYLFLTEVGLEETFNDDMAYCYYFQYPFINAEDVHKQPSWLQDAIFYQIFVERFFNGDVANSPTPLTPWEDDPTPKSFFGGDLRGIIEKLDYLEKLGINAIYLTPIFESPSNHKYDTVDYMRIDTYFGDEKIFEELVLKAHQKGMKIILDAVFNHCGIAFAPFQDVVQKGRASKYYDWFFIKGEKVIIEPPNYLTFSQVPYMPKLNTAHPEVREYLFSVVRYWTKTYGIDGWRLDVSDEIEHGFWRAFRELVKGINQEVVIIGENWHNAYPWLMGDQFDSVMNYPLTKLMGDYFARKAIDAKGFKEQLTSLYMRYPKQVNEGMLNLLDSHDTERFLTLCKEDKTSLKNAVAFLFGYIGIPCTYYGTEIGMIGEYDPGCRKGFDWCEAHWDQDLYHYYKRLIAIRKHEKVLQTGEMSLFYQGKLFVMRRYDQEAMIDIVINQTQVPLTYEIVHKGKEEVGRCQEVLYNTLINQKDSVVIPAGHTYYIKIISS